MSFLRSAAGAAGTLLGGPVGGVLGGLAGSALGRLFGGRGGAQQQEDDPRSRLLAMMQNRGEGQLTTSPTFQAGAGELRRNLAMQGDRDAGRLAATGLRGGETAIGMAANRGQQLTSGLSGLFQQAGQDQMMQQQMLMRSLEGDEDRQMQRRQGTQGLIGSLAGSAFSALPDAIGLFTGKGGGSPTGRVGW